MHRSCNFIWLHEKMPSRAPSVDRSWSASGFQRLLDVSMTNQFVHKHLTDNWRDECTFRRRAVAIFSSCQRNVLSANCTVCQQNQSKTRIVLLSGMPNRELHGNGDGGNTAVLPRETCGNTAVMELSIEGLPRVWNWLSAVIPR